MAGGGDGIEGRNTPLKPLRSMMIHFVSGLPRSGSTLLCGILNQNPRFHASGTSGLVEAMFLMRNRWDAWVEHRAMEESVSERKKLNVLKGIVEAYYADVDRPVVFDKARGWLAHIEMAEYVLERKVKVLVPVRNVAEVLASFELLWRKTSASRQMAQEKEQYFKMQTVEGRCETWMQETQPVGLAVRRLKDAVQRGLGDRLFFVPYDGLTRESEETMRGAYGFLEEEWFDHDFDNVAGVKEDDRVHGIPGLHDVRGKVEAQAEKWPWVLGPIGQKYAGMVRSVSGSE